VLPLDVAMSRYPGIPIYITTLKPLKYAIIEDLVSQGIKVENINYRSQIWDDFDNSYDTMPKNHQHIDALMERLDTTEHICVFGMGIENIMSIFEIVNILDDSEELYKS